MKKLGVENLDVEKNLRSKNFVDVVVFGGCDVGSEKFDDLKKKSDFKIYGVYNF